MRITDQALNRLNVLKAIRRWGPVSRTELTGRTGLSSGSISQLTAELLDRELIFERKEAAAGPGRPRTNLEVNSRGSIVVGAAIGNKGEHSYLEVSFIDLVGNRLHACELPVAIEDTLADMAMAYADALATAIAASPFAATEISRVGFAIPALVDTAKGEVHFMTTYPETRPVPFAAPISARLGLPVTIENDVTCMARAEHWFGRAENLDTFTLVHLGIALGSAEYEDGLPKSGANGLNSELGHIKLETGTGARACYCGGHGCLTAYASMFGLLNAGGEISDGALPWADSIEEHFDRFMDLADSGDIPARDALRQAAVRLGVALANLIGTNDPGNVLVVVDSPRLLEAIREPVEQAVRANVMPGILPVTRIDFMVADKEWRWHGAAALALEQAYLGND